MRNKKTEKCKARGVSLPQNLYDMVDKRLLELSPRVKGFSHYVQLLVDWDLKRKKEEEPARTLPFNQAQHQLAGLAV